MTLGVEMMSSPTTQKKIMKQTEQMTLGLREEYIKMSKIGTIHMELEEQAAELGFESLEQATNAGCEINWLGNTAELVEPLELAHREWEKEKEEVRTGLAMVADNLPAGSEAQQAVERAIKFIEEAHE